MIPENREDRKEYQGERFSGRSTVLRMFQLMEYIKSMQPIRGGPPVRMVAIGSLPAVLTEWEQGGKRLAPLKTQR